MSTVPDRGPKSASLTSALLGLAVKLGIGTVLMIVGIGSMFMILSSLGDPNIRTYSRERTHSPDVQPPVTDLPGEAAL